jgi:hypothetical protein
MKRAAVALPAMLVVAFSVARAQTPTGSGRAAATRPQLAAFEGALENAVRQGTQGLDQRLQASTAANWVMLAGLTRARGFRLEDYGAVFDVEFPSMRRSMVWSFQELQRASAGGGRQAEAPAIQPREIYQTEITNALVNAIVEYSGSVGVGPGEWLTVAARESGVDRRFVPGDPSDAAMTLILRIKGSDLQEIRDGRISREEGRKRVQVTSY